MLETWFTAFVFPIIKPQHTRSAGRAQGTALNNRVTCRNAIKMSRAFTVTLLAPIQGTAISE